MEVKKVKVCFIHQTIFFTIFKNNSREFVISYITAGTVQTSMLSFQSILKTLFDGQKNLYLFGRIAYVFLGGGGDATQTSLLKNALIALLPTSPLLIGEATKNVVPRPHKRNGGTTVITKRMESRRSKAVT